MYNAMSPITPRPYTPQGTSHRAEEEKTDTTGDSLQNDSGQNSSQQQNTQQNNQTITSGQAEDFIPQKPMRRPNVMQKYNANTNIQVQPTVVEASKDAQEIKQTANDRPINAVSNKVNIAQIIKDFRNTMSAIALPDILKEEVEDYLNGIIQHTKGEAPSINYVQTNLLNAASIVDKYISEMLNKESQVVEKWLGALFLQRINYQYNDGEINQAFLVKFPNSENKQAEQPSEPIPQPEPVNVKQTNYEPIIEVKPVKKTVYEPIKEYKPVITTPIRTKTPEIKQQTPVPKTIFKPIDTELKSLFTKAQKYNITNNPSKAMDMFNRALERAKQINDTEFQSKICLEMGNIYSDNNYLVQALNSYNRSLKSTTDNRLKTEAHYSMAKIYDDVNQIGPAIKHYMTSVSYAGENNNLVAQSKSLTQIANIFSDKFDLNAFDYYNEALTLVSQTNDEVSIGFVKSNTAQAYTTFNKPKKALEYYAEAVKNYSNAESNVNVAENYKLAAELMLDMNKKNKAKTLLHKALIHADKTDDIQLMGEITDLLELIK